MKEYSIVVCMHVHIDLSLIFPNFFIIVLLAALLTITYLNFEVDSPEFEQDLIYFP